MSEREREMKSKKKTKKARPNFVTMALRIYESDTHVSTRYTHSSGPAKLFGQ